MQSQWQSFVLGLTTGLSLALAWCHHDCKPKETCDVCPCVVAPANPVGAEPPAP